MAEEHNNQIPTSKVKLKVAILGGGVAGSYLHWLLSREGVESELFDPVRNYFKACGEVVTGSYAPKNGWKVLHWVKTFNLRVDSNSVYSTTYRYAKWQVVDKYSWVNSMRTDAKHPSQLGPSDILVDARGPYAGDRERVCVVRALIKGETDAVTLDFSTKRPGFFWIFPSHKGLVSVGGGFLGESDPRSALMNYLTAWGFQKNVISVLGAPLSIGQPSEKKNRIGEARGLVMPLAGEGIRPAAISAEAAAWAISRGRDLNDHIETSLADLTQEMTLQSQLLRVYAALAPSLRRVVLKTLLRHDYLVEAYLSESLTPWTMLTSLLEIPRLRFQVRSMRDYDLLAFLPPSIQGFFGSVNPLESSSVCNNSKHGKYEDRPHGKQEDQQYQDQPFRPFSKSYAFHLDPQCLCL